MSQHRGRRRRRRYGRRSLGLRDAIVFTAPILLALGYLFTVSLIDFRASHQYSDWWSARVRARHLFKGHLQAAIRLPRAVALKQRMDPAADDPGILRLRVDRDLWDRTVGDPAGGWDVWIDAMLVQDGNARPVKLRKRGDTSVHWTTPKRSFTLRTPRSDLYKGFRRVGVSGKEVLSAYLANRLPSEVELLVPYTAVTPVFLNDQFYGVFRFVEVPDESFLRRSARLPGEIYRADRAERGEYYKGLPRNVFANPYIWDRTASVGEAQAGAGPGLVEFLSAVNGSTFEDHLSLMELVDRDEIARLVAMMLIVGDPWHMSGVHNQHWYEDPSTGTLHPIVWDLRLFDLTDPRGQELSDFLHAAVRDPFLIDEALRVVHQVTRDGALYETAERWLGETWDRYQTFFEYDRQRRELLSDMRTPDEILAALAKNLETLDRWLADSRTRVDVTGAPDGVRILDLQTAGYAGSDLVALDWSGDPLPETRLIADRNLNGQPDAGDQTLGGRWERTDGSSRFVLEEPLALLPGWRTDDTQIWSGNVHYRLFVLGAGGGEIEPVLRNRLTGAPSAVESWSPEAAILPATSWSPWQFPTPAGQTVRLAGEVRLDESLVVGRADTLIVAPGTTVQLDPDVSILSAGRVEAEGTSGRPIRFVAAVRDRPWGAVVLRGPNAGGSRFAHVEFSGGGGARIGRVEYKGMVSVHWAEGVRFEDVRFADNLRSDDALNAVHAEVAIRGCEFVRANGDAIDLDHSDGLIEECRFEGSRNDAIDLMGSSPRISNVEIVGSGDKGISVGERSHPIVLNTRISASTRGIEIKDGSRPLVAHSAIEGNEIGVLQNVKNWRYGAGGWGRFAYTRVSGNGIDYEADAASRLTALESEGLTGGTEVGDRPAGGTDPTELSATRPDWLYSALGVSGDGHGSGPQVEPTYVQPRPPLDGEAYQEAPRPEPMVWSGMEGVSRLGRRGRSLVAWVERGRAIFGRPLDWRLETPGRHQAVLELSGRDVTELRIAFETDSGSVERDVTLPADPSESRWVTVELPPGRYHRLRIEFSRSPGARRVNPETGLIETRSGRLELREWALYELGPETTP